MLSQLSRIAIAICAALFFVFAALQYNDPDPIQWMAIYGAAAVACALAAWRGRIDFRMPLAVLAAALIWAALELPAVLGHKSFIDNLRLGEGMRDPQTEISREVGGLLIIAFVMLPLSIASFRARPIRNRVPSL